MRCTSWCLFVKIFISSWLYPPLIFEWICWKQIFNLVVDAGNLPAILFSRGSRPAVCSSGKQLITISDLSLSFLLFSAGIDFSTLRMLLVSFTPAKLLFMGINVFPPQFELHGGGNGKVGCGTDDRGLPQKWTLPASLLYESQGIMLVSRAQAGLHWPFMVVGK